MSASQPGRGPSRRGTGASLQHIPGTDFPPLIGQSLKFLADPLAFCRELERRYGPVSRGSFLFERRVNLLSADANEFVLLDRAHNFSAYGGWHPVIGALFPRGLMLRDGDDHREQRRLLQPAFRKEALARYLARMNPRIASTVASWRQRGSFLFYPEVKRLTLELASDVFLGLELQSEVEQVNRDFADVVEATTAVVRVPLLGRRYARGLRARARLERFLRARIPARRAGGGDDLFSQLCRLGDDDGSDALRDDEIVDHLIFLMMAAHDTTTSAITTIVYALARHPEWQERLRGDALALGKPAPDFEDLDRLVTTDWVLREALRLYPPLTVILRRAVRDCEIDGFRIPANTAVNVFPIHTQRLARWWSDPEAFDPERFAPARAEHRRHPFAWVPFGGGAHSCLGLHFAELQVKAILQPLLTSCRIEIPAGYRIPYQLAPIAKPRDGLPVRLETFEART
ncbi:MAG: cytochrome P450 [Nevskia sp.]